MKKNIEHIYFFILQALFFEKFWFNQKFYKSKFSSKTDIHFEKIESFWPNSEILVKNRFLSKVQNCGQKSNLLVKQRFFVKNRNFGQRLIFVKSRKLWSTIVSF